MEDWSQISADEIDVQVDASRLLDSDPKVSMDTKSIRLNCGGKVLNDAKDIQIFLHLMH